MSPVFPVSIFLAFLGINAFERGLMDYHDRRIAKERIHMAEQRKDQQFHSSSDGDGSSDSDFSDSDSDSDWSAEDASLKPSLRYKRAPRAPRKKVRFAPGTRHSNSIGRSVYSRESRNGRPEYTRNNGKAGSWNGTHWDSFINEWTNGEPSEEPWGTVPPVDVRNSASYGQEPYVQASHAERPKTRRRATFE